MNEKKRSKLPAQGWQDQSAARRAVHFSARFPLCVPVATFTGKAGKKGRTHKKHAPANARLPQTGTRQALESTANVSLGKTIRATIPVATGISPVKNPISPVPRLPARLKQATATKRAARACLRRRISTLYLSRLPDCGAEGSACRIGRSMFFRTFAKCGAKHAHARFLHGSPCTATDMKSYKVIIMPTGKTVTSPAGTAVADIVAGFGVEFPCGRSGRCGKCRVEILSGKVATEAWVQQMLRQQGLDPERWCLACHARIKGDVTIRISPRSLAVTGEKEQPAEKEIDYGRENGYGIAVDLGSTTLTTQLVDLHSGEVLATASALNPQSRYGADIISRIAYALRNKEAAARLQHDVRQEIGDMIQRVTAPDRADKVCKVVIVGNSAMHHLFCGLDVTPLSKSPFQSSTNGARTFSSRELGWALPECPVTFLPNLSHFVGSDILAGIEALHLHRSDKWQALIDLGTNGEIAIGSRRGIVCTSTAAGPAFEGINISQGMRASTGAICQVDAETGNIRTIGDVPATGICGSGLIDAIFFLRKHGIIDATGTFTDTRADNCYRVAAEIALTQRDIYEYLLAQAAIATGLELLLHEMDLKISDLEHVYVAGGMGYAIDLSHAAGLGLLDGHTERAGNTALKGARRFLYAQTTEDIRTISRQTRHFALESCPDFQDTYVAHLFLQPES